MTAPYQHRGGADNRERGERRQGESVGAGCPGVDEEGGDDDGAEGGDGLSFASEHESEGSDGRNAHGAHDGGVWADECEDCSQDEDGGPEA